MPVIVENVKELLKNLPSSPGIYRMLDREGKVIYVGKAKDLRKRVASYFQKDYQHSTRMRKLLENTADIEFTQTDTELEALLLETNLIKELRPKYNILMKDDKSYIYIVVNLNEDFPRISIVRAHQLEKLGREKGQVKYFGPKLASSKVYETLRILKKLFPFRHCRLEIEFKKQEARSKYAILQVNNEQENLRIAPNKNLVEVRNRVIDFPCLDYFIKRCPGPCIGAIAPIEYKKIVQQIIDFLSGKTEKIENELKRQMLRAAEKKLFEKAGRIRDKLFALQSITERQKITDQERQDTDVINFTSELGKIYFNIFMIRGGKLMNQENFILDALEIAEKDILIDTAESLESFLTQYYEKAAYIPKEIIIPEQLENTETLEKWLTEKKSKRVRIINPQRGEKNKLLELSLKNAISFAKQYRIKWLAQQKGETALARLAEVLGIKAKPLKRIEGFDISHLGGAETVGSMVVFENGLPKFDHYRHFKLRTISGKPDDYKSMEEVLMRRFKYLMERKENLSIRKPSKKFFESIQKIIGKEIEKGNLEKTEIDQKTFFCLFLEKTLIGFLRVLPLLPNAAEIKSLWIEEKHRGKKYGYELMKRIMKKSPCKKFYVYIKSSLENYYAEFGFKIVKEIPEIMRERIQQANVTCCDTGILMMMEKKALFSGDLSFHTKPDLLVIDGGKGQLSVALFVLQRLQLQIPVIALAKRLEEIYLPGTKAPLLLEEGDEALKLLQRIRDESHRFAIMFQRKLHRKELLYS